MKLSLQEVTLVAVASTKVNQTIEALNFSSKDINFSEVCLLTHLEPKVYSSIKLIKIKELKSIKDWSKFVLYDLKDFISTQFILLIHWDGFVINPKSWDYNFLNYDFIGSPWPKFEKAFPEIATQYPDNKFRVGNSVSLRSKKFLEIPSKINLKWDLDAKISNFHEDGYICVQKREELEKNAIKFAPFHLACKFGREYTFKENLNIDPFVFHKWYGKNKNYPILSHSFSMKERVKRFLNFGFF